MRRFTDALRFYLERFLLRGSGWRLLLMAFIVVVVSCSGGLLLKLTGATETLDQAVWWAFLRLTDPGYLGDDDGIARRVVSTGLTVAGYVLFMGALIAILTQALQETITRLQRGESPIVMRGHILVLGLTERTPVVLTELMRIETRVERFLARIGRRRDLRVVVLVDELDTDLRSHLKEEVGAVWDDRDIILRSGSALVAEHLERVDFANAAAILIPGGREEENDDNDMRDATVVKTLLSIARHPAIRQSESPPRLVAELADARLVDVVRPNYPGEVSLLPADAVTGRIMAQNLRHRGLSWVLSEILAMDHGSDLYFHDLTELNDMPFAEAAERIARGIAIGFVRSENERWVPYLDPPADEPFLAGDRMVVLSQRYEDIRVIDTPRAEPYEGPVSTLPAPVQPVRRVQVLGWSPRLLAVLSELETYEGETIRVDVMSVVSIEARQRQLLRSDIQLKRVELHHTVGDYTNVRDVRSLDLLACDNLLILGRAHLEEGEQSDAQTLVAYLIVRNMLRGKKPRPSVLVELMDRDNAGLFDDVPGEVVLSPTVMGRLLAHLTLRPELSAVLDELLTVGGAEICYRSAADYGLEHANTRFDALSRAAQAHGELLIGVRTSDTAMDVSSALQLAPTAQDHFDINEHTRLAVITHT